MKIFLDDVRIPEDCSKYMHTRIQSANKIYLEEWVIVRNYKEFCSIITNNHPNITHISYDHDLADCFQLRETLNIDEWFDVNGNREYTGLDCAKFMKDFYNEKQLKYPIMFVHSLNPVGTNNIINLFK